MKRLLSITLLSAMFGTSPAQGLLDSIALPGNTQQLVATHFAGTRIGSGLSAETASKGELKMLIQHRFGNLSGGVYQFFGLDQATMRLGFEYGITDNLSLSTGRSTQGKSYDFGARAALLRSTLFELPLTLTANAEGSVNTLRNIYPAEQDKFTGRSSFSFQLAAAITAGRLSLQLTPTLLHTAYELAASEPANYFVAGMAGSIDISRRVSLTAEYYHLANGLDYMSSPLTIGVDLDTGGHLFQLLFSNTTGMINRTLLAETTGKWGEGDIYFGFNLVRTFYTGNN